MNQKFGGIIHMLTKTLIKNHTIKQEIKLICESFSKIVFKSKLPTEFDTVSCS